MITLKYYFKIEPRCAEHMWLDGEIYLYNHVSEIDLRNQKVSLIEISVAYNARIWVLAEVI